MLRRWTFFIYAAVWCLWHQTRLPIIGPVTPEGYGEPFAGLSRKAWPHMPYSEDEGHSKKTNSIRYEFPQQNGAIIELQKDVF